MAELRVVSTWTLVLATGLVVTLWTGARAQEISVEHEILAEGPADPWAKMLGDVDGDGRTDVAIGGREGPLLWYENPDWDWHFIVGGGYETVDGELGDVDGDGDLDVVMGGSTGTKTRGPERIRPGPRIRSRSTRRTTSRWPT